MARIERAGRAVDYEVRGDGARAVLLAHNLFTDRSVFEAHAERLSARCRVIALYLRGHGASEPPAGPYTARDLGDDLLAVLDAAGVARASLVGVSIGASA
ncbi:MAG: alpha/beta fold hydrolase, partial [Polyangiaceae bacterium]